MCSYIPINAMDSSLLTLFFFAVFTVSVRPHSCHIFIACYFKRGVCLGGLMVLTWARLWLCQLEISMKCVALLDQLWLL